MTMQTNTHSRFLLSALGCLLLAATASAQTMPQDNWRDSGLQFGSPTNNQLRSIAIGSGGVYVGEINGGNPTKVLQFTETGTFVRRFDDTFGYILGIACDPAGNVYVLDRTDSRVKKYDSVGNFITQWGSAGSGDEQFSFGTTTSHNMIAISQKTLEVYVCDPGNRRVQVFNGTGGFVRKWGQAGTLPGQFNTNNPNVIAVSDDNRVYVGSNTGSGTTHIIRSFDGSGVYVSGFNTNNTTCFALAVTQDGLLAGDYMTNGGEQYNTLNPLVDYQQVHYIPFQCQNGMAFSPKGHLYGIPSNSSPYKVWVAYREYSEAINFTNPTAIPHPLVLSSSQRAGTNWVDVDYQVSDSDSATVSTALLAVRDGTDERTIGNSVGMRTFLEGTSSNVGANQPTGVTRHVTWNMPADWAVDYANIRVEAIAKDSRNLLGVHWITIPASGGQPAFQVSSKPVTDVMMRDLWLWFMGNGMVNTAYSYSAQYGWWGMITGNSGIYTGFKFCEDYSQSGQEFNRSTPAGRLYAFEQMGARPISGSELQRAQAGNYRITGGVTTESIVKVAATATSYFKGWGDNGSGKAMWMSFSAPNIASVAAGGNNSFIVRADGTMLAAGDNNSGSLGIGALSNPGAFVQVATGVSQVSTGGLHSMFVKTDGTLWGMGNNGYGQLGDGTTTQRNTPVQVATGVSQVSTGYYYTLFIKTDGTLWGMGDNSYGQLGDGTTITRNSPVQITTGVAQVSCGAYHSMFVKTDGTLRAMGLNNYGQLGDGTTTTRNSPVTITTGVQQASCNIESGASYPRSMFVKTNGTLWGCGRNNNGDIGDGTTTQRSTPVQVATAVAQVACGERHTVFRKTDGTLWSMGYNASGQLGDGPTSQRTTPYQFDVGSAGVAAGTNHTVSFTNP